MAVGVCAEPVESTPAQAENVPVEAGPVDAEDCAVVALGAFSDGFSEGFS